MKYLLYLIKHKWLVFLECCKAGIPWRGILHDLSCFLPSEFRLSAKYWLGRYVLKVCANCQHYNKNWKPERVWLEKNWCMKQDFDDMLNDKESAKLGYCKDFIKAKKISSTYKKEAFSDPKFDLVRLRHHRRNGHHWQHWVLILDSGKTKPVEMPERFVREMWCDWVVAGRLQGNDMEEWVEEHLPNMILHSVTKAEILLLEIFLITEEMK